MPKYTLTHLSDSVLLRQLPLLAARDRAATAELLAYIAEVDARRLYADSGYRSMFAYCVEELRMSEDSAGRRIHVARVARRFPAIFDALEDGRLHLTAASLIAAHVTEENLNLLIEAATRKGRTEIEGWLAAHFMAPPTPLRAFSIKPVATRICDPAPHTEQEIFSSKEPRHDPAAHVDEVPMRPAETTLSRSEHALEHVDSSAPHAPEQFRMQVTISRSTHDRLRRAQTLLSDAVAPDDVDEVLGRALKLLVAHLERRKAGLTDRPRRGRPSTKVRTVPAHVRREVWERDEGRCTFVSANGHRCNARTHLNFDHIRPVARGGRSTVQGMRLRCRAHNQLEAERVFGRDFMKRKRTEDREAP